MENDNKYLLYAYRSEEPYVGSKFIEAEFISYKELILWLVTTLESRFDYGYKSIIIFRVNDYLAENNTSCVRLDPNSSEYLAIIDDAKKEYALKIERKTKEAKVKKLLEESQKADCEQDLYLKLKAKYEPVYEMMKDSLK